MGFFEDNAGLFFAAVLIIGAVGGFVGRKVEAWLESWRENRVHGR
jgi:hypothetical protein